MEEKITEQQAKVMILIIHAAAEVGFVKHVANFDTNKSIIHITY